VERTLLSAAFDFFFPLSADSGPQTRYCNLNFKSGGQECPPHSNDPNFSILPAASAIYLR